MMPRKNLLSVLTAVVLFTVAGHLFWSCKKTELPELEEEPGVSTQLQRGLPEDPDKIHGYLYAGLKVTRFGANLQVFGTRMAVFGDPERDLLKNFDRTTEAQASFSTSDRNRPNVSVGRLQYNSFPPMNGFVNYFLVTGVDSLVFARHSTWNLEGNKSFAPLTVTLPAGLPLLLSNLVSYTAVISQGLLIRVSDHLSNYDSAMVRISHAQSAFPDVALRVSAGTQHIFFSPQDLAVLTGRTSANITIAGFNYHHMTVNGKRYLFELSSRIERTLAVRN